MSIEAQVQKPVTWVLWCDDGHAAFLCQYMLVLCISVNTNIHIFAYRWSKMLTSMLM